MLLEVPQIAFRKPLPPTSKLWNEDISRVMKQIIVSAMCFENVEAPHILETQVTQMNNELERQLSMLDIPGSEASTLCNKDHHLLLRSTMGCP
jgi:hypothetical protein